MGYIEVKTHWKFWIEGLNIIDDYYRELGQLINMSVEQKTISKNEEYGTYWGLRQLHGNMFERGLKYGIISTFNKWFFVKVDEGKLYISKAVSCNQRDTIQEPGLLRCILYFFDLLNAPLVSASSSLRLGITIQGSSGNNDQRNPPTSTQTAIVRPQATNRSESNKQPSGSNSTQTRTCNLTIKSDGLTKLLGTGLTCRVYLYTGGYTHIVDNTYYPEIALKFGKINTAAPL